MRKSVFTYKTEMWGLATGAATGWAYWYLEGCSPAECPLTSSWLITAAYGAAMGWLISGIISQTKKRKQYENRRKNQIRQSNNC